MINTSRRILEAMHMSKKAGDSQSNSQENSLESSQESNPNQLSWSSLKGASLMMMISSIMSSTCLRLSHNLNQFSQFSRLKNPTSSIWESASKPTRLHRRHQYPAILSTCLVWIWEDRLSLSPHRLLVVLEEICLVLESQLLRRRLCLSLLPTTCSEEQT